MPKPLNVGRGRPPNRGGGGGRGRDSAPGQQGRDTGPAPTAGPAPTTSIASAAQATTDFGNKNCPYNPPQIAFQRPNPRTILDFAEQTTTKKRDFNNG